MYYVLDAVCRSPGDRTCRLPQVAKPAMTAVIDSAAQVESVLMTLTNAVRSASD